jgi:hypothetical protein
MSSSMNKNLRIWLVLVTLIVVAIVATLWATLAFEHVPPPFRYRGLPPYPPPYEIPWDFEFFYIAEEVVDTVNVALSIILLITYVSIYRKTRSEFTIGLIIFSLVFLLNALASSPLLHRTLGYYDFGLGPFAMLPDLFTFAALSVLLYLSIKY